MTLEVEDFATFFEEIYGYQPFPWQLRLLREVTRTGRWPRTLDLPTGSGKTAAIDVAVFHLALEAGNGSARRAPVRIAFVVDRRLIVDDAFERARRLEKALENAQPDSIPWRVAERLKGIAADGPALMVRRLRGGVPREDDWARTPSQPTVLCSTVDQVGSRLLFRGYGISDSMKPVHAGLLGSDCLILLDEAHLAEPFRQTLEWLEIYRGEKWSEVGRIAPSGVALLTATPGEETEQPFHLNDEDRRDPVLSKRLEASKPACLILDAGANPATDHDAEGRGDATRRAPAIVAQVQKAIEHFKKPEHGATAAAIGVVVNRVSRARAVFELLKKELHADVDNTTVAEPVLMIGPARPLDRDELASRLAEIRTKTWLAGEQRALDKTLIVVATQCIEAGVDIDLDGLISEAAPLDSLRQRFGRLNRAGREITPYASIIAWKPDLSTRYEDPVYGRALGAAWDRLSNAATSVGSERNVDFGVAGFSIQMDVEALAPKEDAPVLLPAHVDLLSQTFPIPAADPDVALLLHGPNRQPDSITLVWRADVDERHDVRRLLTLVPPRSSESIQLPVWTVRSWLLAAGDGGDDLADVPSAPLDDQERRPADVRRRAFRWVGDDEKSRWIMPEEVRSGDTLVVPTVYRGLDRFGWNPAALVEPEDRGRDAAAPFAGRRHVIRIAAGLCGDAVTAQVLADTIAANASSGWRGLRDALLTLPLPATLAGDLQALDEARARVIPYMDIYGFDDDRRPRGVVFVAPLGLKSRYMDADGQTMTTEDDTIASLTGFPLSLEQHSEDVERKAEAFARALGLDDGRVRDLGLAGRLHDAGKADPRFQRWLYSGDPFGPDPDHLLAKSGRDLPRSARQASGLPDQWRHEALSVRLAIGDGRMAEAKDPELVLWLVGTHHGRGRSLFPHRDPEEKAPEIGPQSLAFEWRGLDWPSMFDRLKARYGVWELARMEAIVRLADHRASEARASEAAQ